MVWVLAVTLIFSCIVGVTPAMATGDNTDVEWACTEGEGARCTGTGYLPVGGEEGGAKLHYSAARPAGDGPFPVLFIYTGYGASKLPTQYVTRYLHRGYAVVLATVRGSGCSTGRWDLFSRTNASDGAEVVEWLGTRSWSNGRVGMVGGSYSAILSLLVAAEQPPHLVAISAPHPIGDLYRDVAYPGGIYNAGTMGVFSYVQTSKSLEEAWTEAQAGRSECLAQQTDAPEDESAAVATASRPYDDDFWRERSPITYVDRIRVPTQLLFAWQDATLSGRAVDLLTKLKAPHHVILTNGGHDMERDAIDDEIGFVERYVGQQANGYETNPAIRVWWDVTYGVGAPGRVSSIAKWPAPQAKVARRYLTPGGGLAGSPIAGAPDTYAYDGTTGSTNAGGESPILTAPPFPQHPRRPSPSLWWAAPAPGKALSYTSEPLKDDLTVLGTASVDLVLSSTAPDTDVQVTITEVRDDGGEVYVQRGWLRASHAELDAANSTETRPYHTHAEKPPTATPLSATKIRVEVFPFGHVFRAGSRLRLWVEAPHAAPDNWSLAARPGPAVNQVHHDAVRPSSLALSVLPGQTTTAEAPRCASMGGRLGPYANWDIVQSISDGDDLTDVRNYPHALEGSLIGQPCRMPPADDAPSALPSPVREALFQ